MKKALLPLLLGISCSPTHGLDKYQGARYRQYRKNDQALTKVIRANEAARIKAAKQGNKLAKRLGKAQEAVKKSQKKLATAEGKRDQKEIEKARRKLKSAQKNLKKANANWLEKTPSTKNKPSPPSYPAPPLPGSNKPYKRPLYVAGGGALLATIYFVSPKKAAPLPHRPSVEQLGEPSNTKEKKGHTKGINCIAWSPDDMYLVTGGDDHTIYVWKVTENKVMGLYTGHQSPVNSVSMVRTNNTHQPYLIASGSKASHTLLWRYPALRNPKGPIIPDALQHKDAVNRVNFSSNGEYLIATSGTVMEKGNNFIKDNSVRIYRLDGHKFKLHSVSGKFYMKGKSNTGYFTTKVRHQGPINDACFINQKTLSFATAGADNQIGIWNITNYTPKRKTKRITNKRFLKGHTAPVNQIAYSPKGKYLASCSDDKTIRVWDTSSGELRERFTDKSEVKSVHWSHDGKFLASASNGKLVKIWRLDSSRTPVAVINTMQSSLTDIKWAHNTDFTGQYRLACVAKDKTLKVFHLGGADSTGGPVEKKRQTYSV